MTVLAAVLLASLAAAAEDFPLPEPPSPSTDVIHMDFAADHLDYESSSAIIHMKGGVRIKESTWTIKAEEMWLDSERRTAWAEGALFVEDGVSAAYGDSGFFDFNTHQGKLYKASSGTGDWRIHSQRAAMYGRRRLDYFRADFTSCSSVPPHYHLYSTRVSLFPGRYLLARNAVFFIGPVPIFYLPFFYKSLNPNHLLRLRVQPGLDRRNGAFAKGTLTTPHGDHMYSKVYLDYYKKAGLGAGGELLRAESQDSRGVLYGYRIKESSGVLRWTMLGDLYQGLGKSNVMALQGRLQLQSDPEFNNDYNRSSLLRVAPELINSAAFVYRFPIMTTRLSYSRTDRIPPGRFVYLKTEEVAPRVDFQTDQFSFGLPWLNSFSGFGQSAYLRGRSYLERTGGGGWQGTQSYHLMRRVTFTPTLSYFDSYVNRRDMPADFGGTKTVFDVFVGRYTANNNLRVDTLLGALDAAHTYSRRSKVNSLSDDAGALDHGVETNLLTAQNVFRPTRKILVRAQSGYDFRVFRDRIVLYHDRIQPITSNIEYAPHPLLSLSAYDDYHMKRGNQSFIFDARVGHEQRTFIRLGGGNNLATPTIWFFNSDAGIRHGPWYLIGNMKAESVTRGGPRRLSRLRPFEKEFAVSKDWHDFFTRVTARFRQQGIYEFQFRVDMRLGGSRDKVPRRDWEAEWFAERQSGMYDRP